MDTSGGIGTDISVSFDTNLNTQNQTGQNTGQNTDYIQPPNQSSNTLNIYADDKSSQNLQTGGMEDAAKYLVNLWLGTKAGKTKINYGIDIIQFQKFAQKNLLSIRMEDIQKYISDLQVNYKPKSVARKVASLKSFYTFITQLGYTKIDIAKPIKIPKTKNELAQRILSQGEVQAILQTAIGRDRLIIKTMYYLGLRAEEVCNLKWQDITQVDHLFFLGHFMQIKTRQKLASLSFEISRYCSKIDTKANSKTSFTEGQNHSAQGYPSQNNFQQPFQGNLQNDLQSNTQNNFQNNPQSNSKFGHFGFDGSASGSFGAQSKTESYHLQNHNSNVTNPNFTNPNLSSPNPTNPYFDGSNPDSFGVNNPANNPGFYGDNQYQNQYQNNQHQNSTSASFGVAQTNFYESPAYKPNPIFSVFGKGGKTRFVVCPADIYLEIVDYLASEFCIILAQKITKAIKKTYPSYRKNYPAYEYLDLEPEMDLDLFILELMKQAFSNFLSVNFQNSSTPTNFVYKIPFEIPHIGELMGKNLSQKYIFGKINTTKNTALDTTTLFKIVRKNAKSAGIWKNVSPHWFRHSHASHSLEKGAPLTLIQQSLGHSSLAITGQYLHIKPSDGSSMYL